MTTSDDRPPPREMVLWWCWKCGRNDVTRILPGDHVRAKCPGEPRRITYRLETEDEDEEL